MACNRKHLAVLVAVLLAGAMTAASAVENEVAELDSIPVLRPEFQWPTDPNLLFFVQRSMNSNTIVYTARLKNGQLDTAQPVEVFWRRFNTTGERKALSFAEDNVAFGVHVEPIAGRRDAVLANVVSYPNRKALIELDEQGRPRASIMMGQRRARLIYAYVVVDDSGMMPSVKQVDIFGTDLQTGRALHEKFVP